MHEILQRLNQDHGNVARLLDLMDAQAARIARGDDVHDKLLLNTMRYLTQYQDIFHHPKEDLMFARMMSRSPATCGDISALQSEHQVLYEAGRSLYERLRVYGEAQEDLRGLEYALEHYAGMLRRHMQAESDGVFPLAGIILSMKDWNEIEEALQSKSDPLFGPSVEHGYQVVLSNLAASHKKANP